jgi:AcrR family transcriptional regulator
MNGRLPRGSLDSEVILGMAERLAGESGLAEVTIRKVAAALDVRHSAVHYHFPKRDLLVNALLERGVRQFNARFPKIDSEYWEEHLRGYWDAYRSVLRDDPALFEVVVAHWATMGSSQQALDLSYERIDAQLKVLLEAGFSAEQAGYAYHLLSTYTRGCLISERQFADSARGFRSADGTTHRLPGLAGKYPSLDRAVTSGWSYTFATDADFSNGLTVIIAGLRAWLPD